MVIFILDLHKTVGSYTLATAHWKHTAAFALRHSISAPPCPPLSPQPGTRTGYDTFASELLFLFRFLCVKKLGRGCERERVLQPSLFSFLLSIILRRISCEVHREEVPQTCWGPAHPSSAFQQPGHITHTYRQWITMAGLHVAVCHLTKKKKLI